MATKLVLQKGNALPQVGSSGKIGLIKRLLCG
jgi:hypothetical protein